jgi:ribonuclease HI
MNKDKIVIYTDGAARGNPGKAGWAAIVLLSQNSGEGRVLVEIGGNVAHATNNQMELTAPIEALKYIKNNLSYSVDVEIFSDSKYVILGITEWIHGWIKNNWRNSAKKPVLNKELWEELYTLTKDKKVKWNFKGEIWEDEIGHFRSSLENVCPKEEE